MQYFLSVLSLSVFLFLNHASLLGQDVHACVVMPKINNSGQPRFFSPNQLPPGVHKAVALGGPSTNVSSSFWANGSTLRIRFLDGSTYLRQQVARYAQEWTRYANINFRFVSSGPSDIRISFVNNGSSWSMLGSQARGAGANQPTMNFGWFTESTPDYELRRTILHEFGHALGLLHEHQNPSGGIPWNEAAVYDFYRRTQGWDQATTHRNVIARQRHDETQFSAYDPLSIMHYPVDPRLTTGGYEVGLNTSLSATDIEFISRVYPGRNVAPSTTPPVPPQPTYTSDRPSVPTAQPAKRTASITITNMLGEGVKAETVELYINNRKYVFRLSQGGFETKALRLDLTPGTYQYRINSASVYDYVDRVWNGHSWVYEPRSKTIQGRGKGILRVSRDDQLVFYGKFNEQTGRMKVYLGEREQQVRR